MKHRHTRKPNNRNDGAKKKHRSFGDKRGNSSEAIPAEVVKPKRVQPTRVVGLIKKASFGFTLQSTDRRDKNVYFIRASNKSELHLDELVVCEILPNSKAGRTQVQIKHHLGNPDDPKNVSLIAIHGHNIPFNFSDAVQREAESAKPVPLGDRTDLRKIPLITIDGVDARDFDDAVFAEPDTKTGGWHLIVAIADVAHYVRPDSALDHSAYERGNSVYFADRVVPMLPEALSNELCSLKPNVERACMAVHLWLDDKGELTRWEFVRGLMKSHARLTYEQVQAAMDGHTNDLTAPLLETVIKPLYGAYQCLMQARLARGTLELNLPERKVELGDDGAVKAIKQRERLDSHKLIEEFMICANVAAAAQLESKGGVCLYRIHDKPSEIKLLALREFLESLNISLAPAKQLHPKMLTKVLDDAATTPHSQVVNEVMLRSQSQAVYSPENIGHFGLALAKYAHFTSPIRRYADLIVHRGLIRTGKLGNDGLTDEEIKNLSGIAEHISGTERRAATAERDVNDRYTTLFLANKIGSIFSARISGVARFGLFARLDETGADGIIPFSALPHDYYHYDEKHQALIGQRKGLSFQLAQKVKVRLEQADKLTGSISFAIVSESEGTAKAKNKRKPPLKKTHEKPVKKRRK